MDRGTPLKLRSVPDATLILDDDYVIVDRNAVAEEMFGDAATRLEDLFSPASREALPALLDELQARGSSRAEVEVQSWSRATIVSEISISRFRGDGCAYQVNIHDVMHRKRNEAQLRHVATHDSLTDLPNRLALLDRLGHYLSAETPAALVWCGIDRFKMVNDSLGYRAGDELLVAVGDRILETVGDESRVAHLGGDQFAVILEQCMTPEAALDAVRDLAAAVRRPLQIRGRPLYVTSSLGIALYDAGYSDPEDWLADAEIALARAKRQGRDQATVFDKSQRAQVSAQLDLENELRSAIENDEFELHYQPIVALADQQLVAFEALVRWRSKKRGLLSPGAFLTALARAGMQGALDRIVLRKAIKQLAEWNRLYGIDRVPRLHVNVSSERFVGQGLLGEVERLLNLCQVPASQLELEITEGTLFQYPERVATLIEKLQSFGVRVALDDFGTGFSSLSYLQRYPVDALKIDRSFINVATRSTTILHALVMLGEAMGMDLIAEGIESAEEFSLVSRLGCEFGQGFHIARPQPAQQAAARIVARHIESPWRSQTA